MFYSFCLPPFPYKNKQINIDTTASGYNAIRVEERRFPHVFQGMMIIIVFSFSRVSSTAAWRAMTPALSPGTTPPSTTSTTSRRAAWRSSSSRRSSSLTATRLGYSLVMLYLPWDNVSGDGKKVNWICFLIDFCCEKLSGSLHELYEAKCCAKVDTKNIVNYWEKYEEVCKLWLEV